MDNKGLLIGIFCLCLIVFSIGYKTGAYFEKKPCLESTVLFEYKITDIHKEKYSYYYHADNDTSGCNFNSKDILKIGQTVQLIKSE